MKKFGKPYDDLFHPQYTPLEMLKMGVFDGKYFRGKLGAKELKKLPKSWQKAMRTKNYYNQSASLSKSWWNDKIHPQDPLGWFQWYCRFYLGRRTVDDLRQIKRWSSYILRHYGNYKYLMRKNNKKNFDRYKQAFLHWAWNYKFDPNKVFKSKLKRKKAENQLSLLIQSKKIKGQTL